jgi:hypothetical protein
MYLDGILLLDLSMPVDGQLQLQAVRSQAFDVV